MLILREMEEMSYREIAAVTGTPIGTVMSRLSRGRALLREKWLGRRKWRAIRPLAIQAYLDGELDAARRGSSKRIWKPASNARR